MPAGKSPYRVLIAGGGPAALELLLGLNELAGELVEAEVIAPTRDFEYRPLRVVEPFGSRVPQRFSLPMMVRDCGGEHRLGALAGVDSHRRRAVLRDGTELEYDALAVAVGALPRLALPGALTFGGGESRREFSALLEQLVSGTVRRVAFAVPGGVVWSFPLYELALMTAAHCRARGAGKVELSLVTPEDEPLALFGRRASASIGSSLSDAGIVLESGSYPLAVEDGHLRLTAGGDIPADRVVTMPRLVGPELPGLPQDPAGFIPTDRYGRVRGVADVYAAGDVTTFAIKQGGLATQQAIAAAESIAAAAGAPTDPHPFRPVLRGLLLTGGPSQYLRNEPSGGQGDTSRADAEPLWWPPGKIAGGHLSHYLASLVASG
jgi:sulfide:quinone oxidoreductase